jgi:bifunctional non-homologous end joining protein LigD
MRDNSIRTYRAKRDFTVTSEPAPRSRATKGKQHLFIVQKHAARSLHRNFRLEYGGVLWSWAVPKGPSINLADKRLSVRVEDHPLENAKFEPEGQRLKGGFVLVRLKLRTHNRNENW